MKKILSIALCMFMVFGLAGCGGDKHPNDEADTTSKTETENSVTEQEMSAPKEMPSETEHPTDGSGKILVVYYSASGNTKAVAEIVAEAAGADLFELTPTEIYTSEDLDWTDEDSRVSREHSDESLRDIPLTETMVANWEEYDTVLIGYPIWWGIAAWPVDGFISANDFTGKTVIPFCTSASSGFGESGELLEETAGTGTWLEGKRFSSRPSEEDVRSWVDGLAL